MPSNAPTSFGLAAFGTAIVAATVACTPAAAPQGAALAGRQCFLASQVNSFHPIDNDSVHVTVGANDAYQLEIVGVCPDIDREHRIGIRSHASTSWVCSGYDAELLVPSPIGVNTCTVTDVRRLSEAEAQAIRAARV